MTRTSNLPVCDLGRFKKGIRYFWTGKLADFQHSFSFLQHPHRMNCFLIIYSQAAEGLVEVDDSVYNLSHTTVIVMKPNCIGAVKIKANSKGTALLFSEEFFSLRYNNNVLYQFSFLKSAGSIFITPNDVYRQKQMLLLELMQSEFDNATKHSTKILRSYLNILLFGFEQIFTPSLAQNNEPIQSEKLLRFEKMVEENFMNSKLPSEYATKMHITTNYLNKICKEQMGTTAGEIIRKRVVIEAQRLLHYTQLNVNEIALRLGFENTSYFVTFFKKYTEVSPEKFRKLN